jgi:hypothetical protein
MPNKVIAFPQNRKTKSARLQQRIICQIGDQRFAIDWTIVDLPPEPNCQERVSCHDSIAADENAMN